MTSRPLSHLRVLDFGHFLAGPMVGMILADMGAEVIRIDPPGGPRWKDPAFDMLSRGKRSVVLDLKTADGRQKALDLAARSDVVIENFRPGVMERLGLGPAALRQANPAIVSLSLPGFASADPEFADLPAWEAVIAARTGQFTDMGLNRRLMGINPSFTPLGLASAYGAAFGAMSVLFALGARDRNGGDHIEVPLASALFEGLVYNSEQVEAYPDRYKSPRELELDRRAAAGLPLDLAFADLWSLLDPFYRTYMCADGRGFYVVSCSIKGHQRRALEVLGLHALAESLPDFDAYLDRSEWPADWALRNFPVGPADRARVADAMQAAFLTRPSTEWEALFGAAKAPGTAQRTSAEWLADPHALAAGLVLEVDDPRHGRMRQMGNVAWLADDAAATDKRPGPVPDDLRPKLDAILAEAPRGPADGSGAQTGWLDGVKVVDLTNVIAGPTIGATLARFGAKVTHVQPVDPSVDPWNAVVFGLQAQRGKESVLLDLSCQDGRRVLDKLIAGADVVTMNGTDAQRDALGLSPDRLAAINPALILVQLDAFGGPRRGPKSDHLGYDDLAQAATGVMLRFGGGMETPEEHAHFGTIDVLTGFCACVSLGAALERRRMTGRGGLARAALAAAGEMIQAQFMYDFAGRGPWNEPSGREALGWDAFYRCYRAADGWMFFAAPTERAAALARIPALADLATMSGDAELAAALAERLATRPIADWVADFAGGSVGIVPLGSLHATRDASLVLESDGPPDIRKATFRAVRHDRHPMGRWVDLVAPNAVRPERAAIIVPGHAPKYGADTREVLQRAGCDSDQMDAMIQAGSASEGWSSRYLPE
ncbi:CoA transferase [Defluviimonas sp. WL0002]|uniref:CoA transferase n=1 Tax=Albidovulum marisflavi TaxID=2984159 RepID=A0ABT2ZC57_9RHOB|nr:CoA transferase [Defluviimonas sp. WL0002]MCV2868668.1 CoA transferase [Defluviimonas sp. WL0002]